MRPGYCASGEAASNSDDRDRLQLSDVVAAKFRLLKVQIAFVHGISLVVHIFLRIMCRLNAHVRRFFRPKNSLLGPRSGDGPTALRGANIYSVQPHPFG